MTDTRYLQDVKYHVGMIVGLCYGLAQMTDKPLHTFTIPNDGCDVNLPVLRSAWANFKEDYDEGGCFEMRIREDGFWLHVTLATTENRESLPEDWEDLIEG